MPSSDSGGTNSGCISARTRQGFMTARRGRRVARGTGHPFPSASTRRSESDPIAPPLLVEKVHGLDRQEHAKVGQQLPLRADRAEPKLATAADHVPEHDVQRVLIFARPLRHDAANLPTITTKKRGCRLEL